MPNCAISKFECKKVLFNICCQDEVFLPDMLSSYSSLRKKAFLAQKGPKFEHFFGWMVQKINKNYPPYFIRQLLYEFFA